MSPLIASPFLTVMLSPLRNSVAEAAGAARHQHPEATKKHRQRATAPQIAPECEQPEASHAHHGKNLEQAEHGLPSFPECALKHHQIQQVRTAESGLLELQL